MMRTAMVAILTTMTIAVTVFAYLTKDTAMVFASVLALCATSLYSLLTR